VVDEGVCACCLKDSREARARETEVESRTCTGCSKVTATREELTYHESGDELCPKCEAWEQQKAGELQDEQMAEEV
jgi:hypothetical protein